MSIYVDGFVLPVPKKNLTAYRRMARLGGKIWMEHGALEYHEAAGDDLNVKMGKPFPRTLRTRGNETIVFAWVVYKSRAHRDRVNKKVMADPRMQTMPTVMPFDPRRMNYGGFKSLVDFS